MTVSRPRSQSPRVVVTVDINCFYAQVEILKRPELRDQPVGVTQKHLVVTSNYVARRLGVPKMVSILTAKRACPSILLIDGSDLAPYRRANAKWVGAVRDWAKDEKRSDSLRVEKLGLDEVFLDVSGIVLARMEEQNYQFSFKGHVIGPAKDDTTRKYLMIGSQVADDIRRRIRADCGLTSCAGIGASKLCAKLAVDIHKPNDQTTLLQSSAANFIASLPLRHIPGFGRGYHRKLKAFDPEDKLKTAGDVLAHFDTRVCELESILGNRSVAERLLSACRGIDKTEVQETIAPTSITSEDSFLSSTTVPDVQKRLHFQVLETLRRLQADAIEHNRSAKTLTVKFRERIRAAENGYGYVTRAIPMPVEVRGDSLRRNDAARFERAVEATMTAAMLVLKKHAGVSEGQNFDLSLIGIGATNFTPSYRTEDSATGIAKYFGANRERAPAPMERFKANFVQGDRNVSSESEKGFACPVCCKRLPQADNAAINRHIDSCLSIPAEHRKGSLSLSVTPNIKKKVRKRGALDKFFPPSCRKNA